MASVYDRTDIYDLFDSPKKDAQTLSHWQTVFDGRPIRSALDVSIGTGSLTLPLGQLGVSLYAITTRRYDHEKGKCHDHIRE